MSRSTYLVLCAVTTLVVMALLALGARYVIYEISAWWALPGIAVFGIIAWLIDRHEHKQGKLPPPNGPLDRFVWRWLMPRPTEARQKPDAASHSQLDRPE
jgi:hypothetical protein